MNERLNKVTTLPWPAMDESAASANETKAPEIPANNNKTVTPTSTNNTSLAVFKPIETFESADPQLVAVEVRPDRSVTNKS